MTPTRRAVLCRREVTRQIRAGHGAATKFWVRELVRALRTLYQREVC